MNFFKKRSGRTEGSNFVANALPTATGDDHAIFFAKKIAQLLGIVVEILD